MWLISQNNFEMFTIIVWILFSPKKTCPDQTHVELLASSCLTVKYSIAIFLKVNYNIYIVRF